MLIKDADLIVAVGKEVRMTSLTEFQLSASGGQTFKVRESKNLLDQYAFFIPFNHLRRYARQTCNLKSMNLC
jgi:hypothetical protein